MRGRPRISVPQTLLQQVLEGVITVKEASNMYGVWESTIRQRIKEQTGLPLIWWRMQRTLEKWKRIYQKRESGKSTKEIMAEEGINSPSVVSMSCQRYLKEMRCR